MEVTTKELTPGLMPEGIRAEPDVEMFNTMVNKWVRDQKKVLANENLSISLFFNHNLETGETIKDYPRVIYHYIGGRFYLTGVNEGAHAVRVLAAQYNKPFEENGIVFAGFKETETVKNEGVVYPGHVFGYRLEKWIPFHHKDYDPFKQLPLTEKANLFNQKLIKHIGQDLGRYLNLDTTGLVAEITALLRTHSKPIYYKGKTYYAFDIEFRSNIKLPRFLTLGNIKSLGFGRIEPL